MERWVAIKKEASFFFSPTLHKDGYQPVNFRAAQRHPYTT